LAKYKQIKKRCLEADDAAFDAAFYPAQEQKAAVSPSTRGHIPILSFVGHSGSGKTTIIEKVIANLTGSGLKVAVIKHDVHGFEMDRPGKDSWRHKQAGAVATIVSSPSKIGLVMDSDHDHCPEALAHLIEFADLILTEGYKKEPHPKIEVFRPHATGDDKPLCQDDPALLAIVSDEAIESRVPIFGTSDIEGLAAFIKSWLEVDSHLGSG
jgi:molybdopterin-guanine dinucleotide biosynthesis protein B